MGFVEIDPAHLTISLTPEANDVLRGKKHISLRKDVLRAKEKIKKEKIKKLRLDEFSADYDTDLFKRLKELRLEFARAENLPPYVIFHDKTLLEMVYTKPKTLEDMAEISGVGEHKLQKYGIAFLKVLNS